jgi:hypothetical protein
VANFYVNYSVVFGYTTTEPTVRRVIESTATNTGTCILTLNEDKDASASEGSTCVFRHPRRLSVVPNPVVFISINDAKNRRLVLVQPPGGVEDVERSIIELNLPAVDEYILTVDRDFLSPAIAGGTAIITPDYYVSQTRTLTLGNVLINIEDAY